MVRISWVGANTRVDSRGSVDSTIPRVAVAGFVLLNGATAVVEGEEECDGAIATDGIEC